MNECETNMESYDCNDLNIDNLSPVDIFCGMDGFDEYITPESGFCTAQPQPIRPGPQLPESPPDSGSENPYSPERPGHISYLAISPNDIMHGQMYDVVKSDPLPVTLQVKDGIYGPPDLGVPEAYPRYMREPELMLGSLDPQDAVVGFGGKKRKLSQRQVKCEPALCPERAVSPPHAPPSVDDSEAGDDAALQCIRFQPFQSAVWHALCDSAYKPLPAPFYRVDADKGFNYSNSDEAYVCQKKNHFQVTCYVQIHGEATFVKTSDGYKKINDFFLHFYGVKVESPNQTIKVEQSQSDRSKKPFHPVPVECRPDRVTKLIVGRLHFAETTCNNMRKKGKPNPDQRHFQLVVALHAHTDTGDHVIAALGSDRIIVRASNPGQFESECSEGWWQRGVADNTVYFNGRVGINTDRPDESCVIHGNLKVTGKIVTPSDVRAKHNIVELDTAQQLRNVQKIRIVDFNYDPSFAEHSGLLGVDPACRAPRSDTGVLAQEVREVLPDAVKEAGDIVLPNGDTIDKFLVVNKERIFMENVGAVKELCKVTGRLESRVQRLERQHLRHCRRDSAASDLSRDSHSSASNSISNKTFLSDGNISLDHIREVARNIRRTECCQRLSHNSPKYHRKQCRACMKTTDLKYPKYYHTNKTFKSDEKENYSPDYNSTLDGRSTGTIDKQDVVYESIKKQNTSSCLWVGDEESSKYNSRDRFTCCRKGRYWTNEDGDFFSNKFIQVVITILILIMAICLAVMSVLYFREHRERVAALHLYNQQQYTRIETDAHRQAYRRDHTTPRTLKYSHNGIQNGKPGIQPSTAKKPTIETTPKKATTPKSTRDHTTVNYVADSHTASTVAAVLSSLRKAYVDPGKPIESEDLSVNDEPGVEGAAYRGALVSKLRRAGTVGRLKCSQDNSNWVQSDDTDCQIFCCPLIQNSEIPDPDGLEAIKPQNQPEKSHNASYTLYTFDNPVKEKQQSSENNTAEAAIEAEPLKIDLNSVKNYKESANLADSVNLAESDSHLAESVNMAESMQNELFGKEMMVNLTELDEEKRYPDDLFVNATENETNGFRLKRQIDKASSEEGYQDAVSDTDDGCHSVIFSLSTESYHNDSVFVESICDSRTTYNFTYSIPISKFTSVTRLRMNFRTSRKVRLQLCESDCKYGNTVLCADHPTNTQEGTGVTEDGDNTFSVQTGCWDQRSLVLRAHLTSHLQNICSIPADHITNFGYIQYNIVVYRECQN